MSKLLKPKVSYFLRKFLTEDQMIRLLKKIKSKKFGAKDFAIEIEEEEVKFQTTHRIICQKYLRYGSTIIHEDIIEPGKYFHVYIEYIV